MKEKFDTAMKSNPAYWQILSGCDDISRPTIESIFFQVFMHGYLQHELDIQKQNSNNNLIKRN